jgi:hypothetical protein
MIGAGHRQSRLKSSVKIRFQRQKESLGQEAKTSECA